MKLKQLMAGATIAGALGAAALGVGAGAASAAPGPQPGGHGAPAVTTPDPLLRTRADGAATDLAGPAAQLAPDPVGLAAQVDRADPDRTRRTGRSGPGGPGGPGDHGPGGPGGPGDHGPGGPGGPGHDGGPGGPGGPGRGTAMTTAATSTTLRGGTDPRPGVLASHRGRHGTGRFPARWTVELRPDQLLGLPGDAFLEPAVQPVRLQLLRSLDPAVKTRLTRRPLRRLAERALSICTVVATCPPGNGLPASRVQLG